MLDLDVVLANLTRLAASLHRLFILGTVGVFAWEAFVPMEARVLENFGSTQAWWCLAMGWSQ
jgi:hypothetical protein